METYFIRTTTCLLFVSSLSAAAAGSGEQSIRVTSKLEPPYLMKKPDDHLEGNARFEGYIADLLERLASKARFTYIITLVKDNEYGKRTNDGSWIGMIGEVMKSEADIAAASITVSDDRREAVDFTDPFMHFGTDILMKKADAAQSPPLPTISAIRDLNGQMDIKYGVMRGGRTEAFFRESQDSVYKQMWNEMSANQEYGMVASNGEGVTRVRQSDGRYAFIIEGTTADYWVQRKPCDLVKVDGDMDTRQYALAVRHGDQLKAKLDEALRQLEEDGELDELRHKWWVEKSECSGTTSFIAAGSLVITLLTVLTAVAFPHL